MEGRKRSEEILKLERLVYKMANRFRNLESVVMDFEDIVQECWLAVLKASERFDERVGVKFITYAYVAMVNRLKTLWSRRPEGSVYLEDEVSMVDDEGDVVGYEELIGVDGEQEGWVFLREVFDRVSVRARLVLQEILVGGESDWRRLEEKLGISLKGVLEEVRGVLQGW